MKTVYSDLLVPEVVLTLLLSIDIHRTHAILGMFQLTILLSLGHLSPNLTWLSQGITHPLASGIHGHDDRWGWSLYFVNTGDFSQFGQAFQALHSELSQTSQWFKFYIDYAALYVCKIYGIPWAHFLFLMTQFKLLITDY